MKGSHGKGASNSPQSSRHHRDDRWVLKILPLLSMTAEEDFFYFVFRRTRLPISEGLLLFRFIFWNCSKEICHRLGNGNACSWPLWPGLARDKALSVVGVQASRCCSELKILDQSSMMSSLSRPFPSEAKGNFALHRTASPLSEYV